MKHFLRMKYVKPPPFRCTSLIPTPLLSPVTQLAVLTPPAAMTPRSIATAHAHSANTLSNCVIATERSIEHRAVALTQESPWRPRPDEQITDTEN